MCVDTAYHRLEPEDVYCMQDWLNV